MSKSKPSGYQGRKRKKEEYTFVRALPKITSFMTPEHGFPAGSAFNTANRASEVARDVFWQTEEHPDRVEQTDPVEDTFELELSEPKGKIQFCKF